MPNQPAYLEFREEWPAAASSPPLTAGEEGHRGTPVTSGATRHLDRGTDTGPSGVSTRDVERPRRSGLRGIARNVELRYDQEKTRNVLTFHLERYDASGNRLAPVAVEMRNPRHGHLAEGDEVHITGSIKHGTVVARRIVDISTSAEMLGDFARHGAIPFLIVLVFVLAGLVVAGFSLGGLLLFVIVGVLVLIMVLASSQS